MFPTAEVPVADIVRNEIAPLAALPPKFVRHTQCFRSDQVLRGKDARAMIRQHQFDEVELMQIARPEIRIVHWRELTTHSETCNRRHGFAVAQKSGCQRKTLIAKISSFSNLEAFPAPRMKPAIGMKKVGLISLHTLNGLVLAGGRTLVATSRTIRIATARDGSVDIPNTLSLT